MQTKFVDPSTYAVSNQPNPSFSYGVQHVSNENGQPINGFNFSEYEIPVRKILRKDSSPVIGNFRSWPTPSADKFINAVVMTRLFVLCKDKQKFLVEKMGFRETGNIFNEDKLFIYSFCTENSQLEVYIDDNGMISEINRFNQNLNYEAKIPLNILGLNYLMTQVFYDLCRLNLSNVQLNSDHQLLIGKILNISSPFKELDSLTYDDLPSFNMLNNISLLE
ncbi:hypothetical protein M0O54_19400 [Acinetobacter lactucae]|uniref:Uncharacterized protein n=1 Tax=Acinetobacter lactucae TaxID=1785128 RepID=A0AB35K799_9GAMM|nr:hypothetical protein [Acinetobacter lactucae]MDD9322244.1 hypothetical protein [Acinetobacter lactucae]